MKRQICMFKKVVASRVQLQVLSGLHSEIYHHGMICACDWYRFPGFFNFLNCPPISLSLSLALPSFLMSCATVTCIASSPCSHMSFLLFFRFHFLQSNLIVGLYLVQQSSTDPTRWRKPRVEHSRATTCTHAVKGSIY